MGDSFLEDEAKNGEMRGEQGAIVASGRVVE